MLAHRRRNGIEGKQIWLIVWEEPVWGGQECPPHTLLCLRLCREYTYGEYIGAPGCWCCFQPDCRLRFSLCPICIFFAGLRSLRCSLHYCGRESRTHCSSWPGSGCCPPGRGRPFYSHTAAEFCGMPELATGSTTPCANMAE